MNVSKELLAVATELLRDPIAFARNNQDCFKAFAMRDQQWACLLRGSEQFGAWYLRPLCRAAAREESEKGPPIVPWAPLLLNVQLTKKLMDLLGLLPSFQPWIVRGQPFLIASLDNIGAVLMVRCDSLRLVADALQDWGEPPTPVVIDWQNQRNAIASHIPELATLQTAETFVSEDGTLFPLFLDAHLACKSITGTIRCQDLDVLPPNLADFQDWPDQMATPKSLDALCPVDRPTVAPPKKINNYRSLAINGSLVISAAIALYSANAFSIFDFSKQATPKVSSIQTDEQVHSADKEELQYVDLQNAALDSTDTSEITSQSLERQLKQSFEGFDRIPSLDPSAIIADTLKMNVSNTQGAVVWDNTSINLEPLGAHSKPLTTLGETEENSEPSGEQSKNGNVALNRPIFFQSALSRESIAIGKSVIPKECSCAIEIKRPDKLIIEPASPVVIEGNGKQSWRIAIEDEGPELVVELTSKPGNRWQIIAAVGLREQPNEPPFLLQPRDPQNVCNRLVAYNQWINQTIEALQNSKTNKPNATSRSLTAEVKRLSSAQKEVLKAIERWRFIANLSHQFYEEVEMKMELFPAEKK